MASKGTYTHYYDDLPLIAKVLIQIFAGAIVGGVYRIVRYLETKNIVTLVVGLIVTCTGVGNFIAWVIDLVTMITKGEICVLAD